MIDIIAEIKNIAISIWGAASDAVISMIDEVSAWNETISSTLILDDVKLALDPKTMVIRNIENGIYTSTIKSKSLDNQSNILEAIFNWGKTFDDCVDEEDYGNLYLYLKDNYLSTGTAVIDGFNPAIKIRTNSLSHYLVYPKLKYSVDPFTLLEDTSDGFTDMRDIALSYESKLYALYNDDASYKELLNNIYNNSSSYAKSFVSQYITEDPKILSSEREQTEYQSILSLNGKAGVYGDSRDEYLLTAMNGSINFLTESSIKLGIKELACHTWLMAWLFYKDFWNEKGEDFAKNISAIWSEITNSSTRYYDYNYYLYYPNDIDDSNGKLIVLEGNQTISNEELSEIQYTAKEIKIGEYLEKYYKEYEYEGKIYRGPELVDEAGVEINLQKIKDDGIGDLGSDELGGRKFLIRYPSSFIVKNKEGLLENVLYLSTDYNVCRMDFGNLATIFWNLIKDVLNNTLIDINKLYNGYGVYNGYTSLYQLVSNDNFIIDSIEKLRITEFVYALIGFFKGDNTEFENGREKLEGKIKAAYQDLINLNQFYTYLIKKFGEDTKYICLEKFED